MAKITGIGGVFFKSPDPKALGDWYRQHLGLDVQDWGGTHFAWRAHEDPSRENFTVWGPFSQDTGYFDPSERPFMVNLIVDDLDGMLRQLRDAGVTVDEHVEDSEFGRFGWFMDPDGTRIELWQPPGKGDGTGSSQ